MKLKSASLFFILFVFTGCEKMFIGPEQENTSKNNFNILWKTMDENYAQFEVKNIKWDSLYSVYNRKINFSTTENELWDIMAELILHFNDAHVNIFNGDFSKSESGSYILRSHKPDNFSINLVENNYLSDYKVTGSGFIIYGHIQNSSIGYIYISTFVAASFTNMSDWAYDIDKVINALSDCKAIIIDLRNNGGGLIVNEHIIASAFITEPITYLYSRQKTGPKHNELSDLIPITINPRNEVIPFTKPFVVLTNRFTGSGGEYVTLIFKNLPNCISIGDTTLGAFGEVTNVSQLPNGWSFRYPCTITTTPDGKCLEGIGIAPNITVENSKIDIENGVDKQIDYTIQYLK